MDSSSDNRSRQDDTLRPVGAPAARLVMMEGNAAGQKFKLGERTTVGRDSAADIVVDDLEVSRTHCAFVRQPDGSYLVEDLKSRNGTRVNGHRVRRKSLAFGDQVRLGPNAVFGFAAYDAAEEQVLQRQRLETLGRLTAGVAHDLNNMLGAILASCAYMMEMDAEERVTGEGSDCLEDIQSAAARAAVLSKRLLGFTRSQPQRGLVNLTEVCREAVQIAQRTFEASVTLEMHLRPKMYVTGDSAQLLQVVLNLLVNARDAIQEGSGSRIDVRLSRVSNGQGGICAVLTVEDDGPGIPAEVRPKIFEPFFTTKDERTGTGVGLATVKDVVENHGGRVEADNRPGGGARFEVRFPALRRASPQGPITATVARRGQYGGLVVMVEDEALYRRGMQRLLSNLGLSVETAIDGPSGLRRLRQAPSPDLAIVDIDLPGMNGIEVVTQARRTGYLGPVLFISGHRDALPPAQLKRLNASFASKPISAPHLMELLETLMRPPSTPKATKTLG